MINGSEILFIFHQDHSRPLQLYLCGHTALANGLILPINPGGLVGNVVLRHLYVRRDIIIHFVPTLDTLYSSVSTLPACCKVQTSHN